MPFLFLQCWKLILRGTFFVVIMNVCLCVFCLAVTFTINLIVGNKILQEGVLTLSESFSFVHPLLWILGGVTHMKYGTSNLPFSAINPLTPLYPTEQSFFFCSPHLSWHLLLQSLCFFPLSACLVPQGDRGGRLTLQKRWTSFLKARLTCSVPEFDFHFNMLRSVFVMHGLTPQDTLFYGIFGLEWWVNIFCRSGGQSFEIGYVKERDWEENATIDTFKYVRRGGDNKGAEKQSPESFTSNWFDHLKVTEGLLLMFRKGL